MKITKTNKKVIIDGCGITTIKIPKDIIGQKQIGIWLVDRLGFSKYKQGCITNFTFISQEENNNGWIKIEREEDLPEEVGTYFTHSKVSWNPFYRIDVFTGRLKNSFTDGKSCFTHYQPIEKPNPPIY